VEEETDNKAKGSESDAKVLAKAKKRFGHCLDYEADNRDLALDDLRFSEGEQWPDKVKEERERDNRPCLVINKVPLYLRQVVNDIRQIRPSIKVRPVDGQADPETAEVLNGIIRAIEKDSAAESAYDWAAEYAARMGVGYWRILTEYEHENTFDQVVKVERIRNPFSVYLDPGAEKQDGSDAMFGFVVQKMPREEFDTKYPDATDEWEEGQGDDDDYWFSETHVRVAEYWEVEEEVFTLSMVVDPETGQQGIIEGEVPDHLQVVDDRESTRRKVTSRLMTGAQVLETNDWLGKYIPIVRCLGREIDIEGEQIRKGMVRDIKDPQRQYNYFRSASTERIALYAKAPYVGPKGAFKNPKWRQANTKNYAYLEYEGDVAPRREPPPDVSPGFSQEVQVASEEIKGVTGIYDAGVGARSNEVSGVAIDSRRSESDVSNFDFVDNLARAMTYAGKIMVDLIPKIYTGARVVRILKPGGEEEPVQVNQPYFDQKAQKERNYMLETGRYDVTVDIGPSYSTQRKEASDSMLELLKAFPNAAPIIGDLFAKNLDWPDADEVGKRLKLLLPTEIVQDENPQIKQLIQQKDQQLQAVQQQAQQAVQQMQHQIAQLQIELQNKQGDLQNKQAETLRKAKADMQKFVTDITDLEIEAQKDLAPQGLAY